MRFVRLVFAVMCFSISISVFAQQVERRVASETYGTSSLTYVSLTPWDFRPIDSTVGYSFAAGLYWTGGGSGRFEAPVRLPEGALVSYLQMTTCNPSGMELITSSFRGLKSDLSFSTSTGPSSSPGPCALTQATISPVQIDNSTTAYTVEVHFSSVDLGLTLINYQVGYKLQVSPAPGTASFSDVPTTHPFFQYVEALVAAGITAGCAASPPQYCPDAPLTRGQMAVFLSRALGLHWAP